MLPPDGIYAVRVSVRRDGAHAGSTSAPAVFTPLGGGAMSIGVRPTIDPGGARRTVEVFVFDFEGDLYGAELRTELVARLREERKFASLEELKAQMAVDVAEAKARIA
jgi:riboflavin kinase/FMN adenylyltransferase